MPPLSISKDAALVPAYAGFQRAARETIGQKWLRIAEKHEGPIAVAIGVTNGTISAWDQALQQTLPKPL